MMPRIVLERGEIAEIAGVGQLVEVDDRLVAASSQSRTKLAPIEPGASGHQNHDGLHVPRTLARIF